MTNRNREFHQNSAHMLIGALRQTYGPSFAKGCADNERLSDVLAKDASLRRVIRDQEAGKFEQISRSWKAQRRAHKRGSHAFLGDNRQ
jgi:hypothetical protein